MNAAYCFMRLLLLHCHDFSCQWKVLLYINKLLLFVAHVAATFWNVYMLCTMLLFFTIIFHVSLWLQKYLTLCYLSTLSLWTYTVTLSQNPCVPHTPTQTCTACSVIPLSYQTLLFSWMLNTDKLISLSRLSASKTSRQTLVQQG